MASACQNFPNPLASRRIAAKHANGATRSCYRAARHSPRRGTIHDRGNSNRKAEDIAFVEVMLFEDFSWTPRRSGPRAEFAVSPEFANSFWMCRRVDRASLRKTRADGGAAWFRLDDIRSILRVRRHHTPALGIAVFQTGEGEFAGLYFGSLAIAREDRFPALSLT